MGILSSKVARLFEILGPERILYLDALSAEELRALVDKHELARSRGLRREGNERRRMEVRAAERGCA